MFLNPDKKTLEHHYDSQILRIEAWGPNAFRVRATPASAFPDEDWALTEPLPPLDDKDIAVTIPDDDNDDSDEKPAHIRNGRATATVTRRGKLTIKDDKTGKLILEEFVRSRVDVKDPKASALRIEGRRLLASDGAVRDGPGRRR